MRNDRMVQGSGRWVRRGREIILLPGGGAPGGMEGETGPIPATQQGVIHPAIDVHAQYALMRMSKGDAAAQADAWGMLGAVRGGRLGIYKADQLKPAKRAQRLGSAWWKVIPAGEDAVVLMEPGGAEPPFIVFRDAVKGNAARLDAALRRAWRSLQQCARPPRTRPGPSQAEAGGGAMRTLRNVVPVQLCSVQAVPPRRILIFFGYSGSAGNGLTEPDRSNHMVALTLAEHLRQRFPDDDIQVICAWHKNTFIQALLKPTSESRIRQIHYVGHGAGGGLYFGYHNTVAVAERAALQQRLRDPANTMPDAEKRKAALRTDSGLMTGFFTDALSAGTLAFIRRQMARDTLMHVWGCFAGAPTHTYDTTDRYWNLFNAGAPPVSGIARHIAKSLGIRVTAVRDPKGIHGMNYWHRDAKGAFKTDARPVRLPQWLWPSTKSVLWVTYDGSGTADEATIHFMGADVSPANLAPGKPPAWFTDEIPVGRAKDAPPAMPACSAVGVAI